MVKPTRRQVMKFKKWQFAKQMRENPTEAEDLMWQHIRRVVNPALPAGYFFRRQREVCGFIVDFYCEQARVALEVDGVIHQSRLREDGLRDDCLRRHGVHVVRVSNEVVYDYYHAEAVAKKLLTLCLIRSGTASQSTL